MTPSYKTLLTERNGRIVTVTMNRPHVRNAADIIMHNELSRVFDDLNRDPECAVIVLTGAGKAFSAGGDIDSMLEKTKDQTLWVDTIIEARKIFYSMLECEKPIIARVNGAASGLGATLAVYSDIVIAAESASFSDPHVKVGLVAGDGGALMWPMLIGFLKAKEYLFLGDTMSATEAARLGLANYAVPDDQLDAKVDEFAQRLASGPRQAIGWTKKTINASLKALAMSTMELGLSLETLSHLSKDHIEAIDAFRNKRKPNFA
jgi:enoyl-CoA hydratase